VPRGRLSRLIAGLTTTGILVLGSALPVTAAPPGGSPLPPDVAVGEGAPALPTGLSSASWLVVDLSSGSVLAARAGSAKRAPASTLKILTALTFGPTAPAELQAGPPDVAVSGSRAGLVAGVRYRSADLLDALFVASGNDVAQVLAGSGQDPAAAADRMTAAAADLGATDTTAGSVTGLDADGQLTTPYDLAILTRTALSNPALRRAAGLPTMTLTGSDGRAHHLTSSNPLLGRYPGAIGVKTGSTAQAGQTFVGAAERDGRTVAVVLMQAPRSFGTEATKLLDWGFRSAGSTRPIAELPAPGAPSGHASGAFPASEPPAVPMSEDGGGISPLLALAMALTVIASAFTYWQGQEANRARSSAPGARPDAFLPDDSLPDNSATAGPVDENRAVRLPDDDPQSSSERESRSIFAP
jgi:D-alanyl-D-alanine carboxypeptidase